MSPKVFYTTWLCREHVPLADCLTHDPLHVVFEHGCLEEEYTHLLPRLFQEGITWTDIASFCSAAWCFPKSLGPNRLRYVVGLGRREKYRKTGKFVATASEHLMLLPVFLHFLDSVVWAATGHWPAYAPYFRNASMAPLS